MIFAILTRICCFLQNLKRWQTHNCPYINFSVDWLPLSTFNAHVQFSIAFTQFDAIDVHISGDTMKVTNFNLEGEYREVIFGSSEEFESYIRIFMKSIAK